MKTTCVVISFLALAAWVSAAGAAPAAPAVFSVRDFGAKADRTVNDAPAFQAAVDAAAKAGGGTVVVPPGEYTSGGIRLASGVTLRIDAGATVYVSTDPAHYPKNARQLLAADDAERIAVTGGGTINGQATADLGTRWGAPATAENRTGILLFTDCRQVAIRDVKILYSDSWTLHLKRCDGVVIEGVTIKNNPHRLNSDGIDPNSCRNVRIANCTITAGDDCIVLKSTQAAPCENVEVTGCTLESTTAAIKIGTESHGDFRKIRFADCKITSAPVGVGVYLKDGATVEDITAERIAMVMCDPKIHEVAPLFIDIEKRNPDSKIGRVRNVMFKDIDIRTGTGLLFQGMPESPIENLSLRNVTLRVEKADDYAKRKKPVGGRRTTKDERDTCFARLPSYAAFANIRNLAIDGLTVEVSADAAKAFDRSAATFRNVDGATLKAVGWAKPPAAGQAPALDIQDCKNVTPPAKP